MHYRKPLLEAGVELYEISAHPQNPRGTGQPASLSRYGHYSLHAKLLVFDRSGVYIGSMNYDERSRRLNTEDAMKRQYNDAYLLAFSQEHLWYEVWMFYEMVDALTRQTASGYLTSTTSPTVVSVVAPPDCGCRHRSPDFAESQKRPFLARHNSLRPARR